MAETVTYNISENEARQIAERLARENNAIRWSLRKVGDKWRVWIVRRGLTGLSFGPVYFPTRVSHKYDAAATEKQILLAEAQKGNFVSDVGLEGKRHISQKKEENTSNLLLESMKGSFVSDTGLVVRREPEKIRREYQKTQEEALQKSLKKHALEGSSFVSDVGIVFPRKVVKQVVKKTTSPHAGYQEYYQGLYTMKSYLHLGLSPQERRAIQEFMKGPKKTAAEIVWRNESHPARYVTGTFDVYKPSVLKKVSNLAQTLWNSSFFDEMAKRLEERRRERIGEYVLGQSSASSLAEKSFVAGLYEPVVNPPLFLGKLLVAPLVVGKYITKKLKEKEKEKYKTELEERVKKAALIGGASEALGSMIGATAVMPSVDYTLTKVKGWWRTRGLPEVKPESVISKDVLEGRSTFANYPERLVQAPQTVKIQYLYSVNRPAKQALEQAVGVSDEGSRFLGFHATSVEFPTVTKVALGTSESPGLYMAPITSPYFLRLGTPSQTVSESTSLISKFFGKPMFLRKPTIIAVYTKGIKKIPRGVRSLQEYNKLILSRAGKGETYITWMTKVGRKPEMEVIATPGSVLQQVSRGAYTTYMGVRVPIRVYKLLPSAGKEVVEVAKKIKPSSYSSLGLETAPYGTYALLGATQVVPSYEKISNYYLTKSYKPVNYIEKASISEQIRYRKSRKPEYKVVAEERPYPSLVPSETVVSKYLRPKEILPSKYFELGREKYAPSPTYIPVYGHIKYVSIYERVSSLFSPIKHTPTTSYTSTSLASSPRTLLSQITTLSKVSSTKYQGPTPKPTTSEVRKLRKTKRVKRTKKEVKREKTTWHLWVGYQPLLSGLEKVLSSSVRRTVQKS